MSNESTSNWRDDISSEPSSTLKIAADTSETFVFLDEGTKHNHPDYGESIVFKVSQDEQEMRWYVNPRNFDLLGQIKALGNITGTKVTVERKGSTKSETRYNLTKQD